jgi:hypothetical protein
MRATFQIRNPDEIEATVTVTMTIKEWRGLRGQLTRDWPSWKFGSVIGDAIRQAEESFYASDADIEPASKDSQPEAREHE